MKPLTPQQKKDAKAFVKKVQAFEKAVDASRKEFVTLLNLSPRTYRSWLTEGVLPSEEMQAAVRAAAVDTHDKLNAVKDDLFAFILATGPDVSNA